MCGLFIFRQVGLCGEPLIITGDGGFGDDSGVDAVNVSAEVVILDGAGAGLSPSLKYFLVTTSSQ